MKTLFCILGRTASGKDTLSDEVCKKCRINKLISYTTRPPRNNYENTHIFATKEDFINFAANGQIVASTQIGEYYYWSTFEQLQECDLYIINPEGIDFIKQINLPDIKLVTIYIKAPEEERYKRAYIRCPDVDAFNKRNIAEDEQFTKIENEQAWDYIVYNNRFIDACEELIQIITKEKGAENVF